MRSFIFPIFQNYRNIFDLLNVTLIFDKCQRSKGENNDTYEIKNVHNREINERDYNIPYSMLERTAATTTTTTTTFNKTHI